jgi:hypothetical protein
MSESKSGSQEEKQLASLRNKIMDILGTIIITITSGLIGGFISYYFAEKTENYKFELLKMEQAAKVAELFAFWLKCDDEVLKEFTNKERRDHCERLNKLTWELTIWIPDEKLVEDIMNRLSNNSRKDIKEIILSIREQIQKKKSKRLKWGDLVSFK